MRQEHHRFCIGGDDVRHLREVAYGDATAIARLQVNCARELEQRNLACRRCLLSRFGISERS
ncbi:MAG: hypothetical protein QOF09_344 [Alphaproteobacteria bacterium]|nr:hypothetical protein [Alphaproteobacteria bacterium]